MENKIIPVPVADAITPKSIFTYLMNFGESDDVKVYTWYIEGPEEKIIVDTGGKAETQRSLGFPSKQIKEPDKALLDLGINPESIETVILTHLHFDHFEYAERFPNARFIVQKKELSWAKQPHPVQKPFYATILPLLNKVKFEVIEGAKEIADGVEVLPTPGHTPGCQSVVVETQEGKAIIAGFCSINANFYPTEEVKKRMEVIPPSIHSDLMQAYASALEVKKNADIILPLHEAGVAKRKVIP